jgi:hypothetical protein
LATNPASRMCVDLTVATGYRFCQQKPNVPDNRMLKRKQPKSLSGTTFFEPIIKDFGCETRKGLDKIRISSHG